MSHIKDIYKLIKGAVLFSTEGNFAVQILEILVDNRLPLASFENGYD